MLSYHILSTKKPQRCLNMEKFQTFTMFPASGKNVFVSCWCGTNEKRR